MTLEQKLEIKIRDEDSQIFRDATQDEYLAWAYLLLKEHCSCTERKISSLDCHDCFLSGACIASDFKTANGTLFEQFEIVFK